MRYEFLLTGKTPLLMHADSVEWADELTAWRLDPANKKKAGESSGTDKRPAWTWIGYLYTDGKHIVMPAANLQSCMSKAGSRVSMGRMKTFKEAAVSGILYESEFLEFRCDGQQIPMSKIIELNEEENFVQHKEQVKKLGFELDVRRAAVGTAKHVRVRPKFKSWSVHGVIEIVDERIEPGILDDLFSEAGKCGLGDWRPSSPKKPGMFGMFGHELRKLK